MAGEEERAKDCTSAFHGGGLREKKPAKETEGEQLLREGSLEARSNYVKGYSNKED